MGKFIAFIETVILGLILVCGISLLLAFPVMWLWNWLIPSMFGLATIGYWKALGLLILCALLFKGSTSTK